MTSFKGFIFATFFLIPYVVTAQVVVQLRQPPPNQLRIEDFWKVTLSNPTQQTFNVYLTGIASSAGNGRIVSAQTKIFQLLPGMKVITPKDISPINVLDRNKSYEDALRTTGAMPTGDYEICITVYNAETGIILGEECLSQTVEFISGIELQFPENKTRFISGGRKEDLVETHDPPKSFGGGKTEPFSERPPFGSKMSNSSDGGKQDDPMDDEIPDEKKKDTDLDDSVDNTRKATSTEKKEDVVETHDKLKKSIGGGGKRDDIQGADVPGVIIQQPILGNDVGQYGIINNQERDEAISAFKKMNGCEECTDEPVMGSFITFSWLPPTPAPRRGRVTYSLAIKEILLNQSPYDAIISNPAFYKVRNLLSPSYLYPIAARGFNSGKRYAWQVEAFLNGVKITESEINEFLYYDAAKPVFKRQAKEMGSTRGFSDNTFPAIGLNTTSNSLNHPTANTSGLSLFPETSNSLRAFVPQFLVKNIIQQNEPVPQAKSTPAIRLTGNMNVFGENANRRGTGSELPPAYVNFGITPTLSLYEIPFSTTILLSTLGQRDRRNVNSYSLGFDPSAMKKLVQEKMDEELQKAKETIQLRIKEEGEKQRTRIEQMMRDSLEQKVRAQGEEYRAKIEAEVKEATEQKITEHGEKYRQQIETEVAGLQDIAPGEYSPNLVEESIKERAMENLSGPMKFFNTIKAFEVGTTHPDYTRHTMSGTAINGLNVEYNPWILYTAFAGTLSQTKMDSTAFQRNFYAGRLGLGKKESTHSIITLMHAFDDENSLPTDSTNQFSTPKENWVVGWDNKLSFFDNKLQFDAEGVVSLYTRDMREPELINDAIPQTLSDFFKPKMSSSADYMYAVKGSFDNDKSGTKISAEAKMIGPGFITLGNPTLRNDVMSYEAKFDQKLLDNQITLGAGYRLFRDNLIGNKAATTTTNFFTGKLGLNFKGLPTLRITVMPSVQSNDKQITTTDSSKLENNTLLYNITSGYSYQIGPLRANTMALFSYNDSKTLFSLYDYNTQTAQLTQSLSFPFPLSLSASVGMLEANGAFPVKAITFNFLPSYMIGDIWQLSAGFDGAYDDGNSERTGLSITSTVNLWQYITLDVRAEKNLYSDQINTINNYDEFIVRSTLTANW